MDGILVIDKPKGVTSRYVVNEIVKKFNTKKVGHTGTLDPIATGVLVVCIGNATKLVNELTSNDKEYIASVELGTSTDTLDITGNILKEEVSIRTKEEILGALNSFKGTYIQQVPIYSAIKLNGKKLYEYARKNINVSLPKREVEIKSIELIDDIEYKDNKTLFRFKCTVSKGTYIRSLIDDIAIKLNTIGVMTGLIRIRQGKFKIENSVKLDDVNRESLIDTLEVLDYKKVYITDDIEKKVLNGALVDNIYNSNEVLFITDNRAIALYKVYEKDEKKLKPRIMFKGGV